jgi:N-acetylglucosaminyl-diphospho-decaprenol L-rhamnosyltransferase
VEKSNTARKYGDRSKIIPYPQQSNSIKATKLKKDPDKNLINSCSVVIVSYKTGPILIECLNSIFQQEGIHQVILVDNGNTRSLIQQINTIADAEARLEIITGHGNIGFAKGCNLGARRARAHYLLLINPDSIVNDGTISKAIHVFKDYPEAFVLTVRIENSDGSEQRGARRNLMTPWTCLVEQFRLDRLAPDHPHFQRLNLNETKPLLDISPVQCISGAFMLMPKNIYNDLGGMDEEYFLHVEDVDFCMRIEKIGGVILYVPNITVMHQKSTSDVYPGFIEWHKAKSFCTYFEKHFQAQYPKWILNIFASAIYLRFTLRLVPITLSWAYKVAFISNKKHE